MNDPVLQSTPQIGPKTGPQRFVYLDALRGIAAIIVVLYHLPRANLLEPVLMSHIPGPVMTVINLGDVGVQIFFVLSGFVIAYSLRSFDGTFRSFGNFLARRQLRLAPPYWVALLVVVVLSVLHHIIPGFRATESITFPNLLLNMLYVHRIFHQPEVLSVSWTLCLEVQFYLIFTSLLMIPRTRLDLPQLLTILLAVCSIYFWPAHFIASWFYQQWQLFAFGVLGYWVTSGRSKLWVFALFSLLVCWLALRAGNWKTVVACGTAISIIGVARLDRLGSALRWRWLQFMGMISYSLYLIHFPVEVTVFKLGYKLTHENATAAFAYCAVSVSISLAAAWLLFEFVERPSMKAASLWKRGLPAKVPIVETGVLPTSLAEVAIIDREVPPASV
jgi:peptidoglycan/LPS O-acetylase OafA/YrhL